MTPLSTRALIPRPFTTHVVLAILTACPGVFLGWASRGAWWGSVEDLGAIWPVNGLVSGSVAGAVTAWIVGSRRASAMTRWTGVMQRPTGEPDVATTLWGSLVQLAWSALTAGALILTAGVTRGLDPDAWWMVPLALLHLFGWSLLCGGAAALLAQVAPRLMAVVVATVAPYALTVLLMQLDFAASERFPLADLAPQELPAVGWHMHFLRVTATAATVCLLGATMLHVVAHRPASVWAAGATAAAAVMVVSGGTTAMSVSAQEPVCTGSAPQVCVDSVHAPALRDFHTAVSEAITTLPAALRPAVVAPPSPEGHPTTVNTLEMVPTGAGMVGSLWVDEREALRDVGHAVFMNACAAGDPSRAGNPSARADPRAAQTVGELWWLAHHGFPAPVEADPSAYPPALQDEAQEANRIVSALLKTDEAGVNRYWERHAEAVRACSPDPLPMP